MLLLLVSLLAALFLNRAPQAKEFFDIFRVEVGVVFPRRVFPAPRLPYPTPQEFGRIGAGKYMDVTSR